MFRLSQNQKEKFIQVGIRADKSVYDEVHLALKNTIHKELRHYIETNYSFPTSENTYQEDENLETQFKRVYLHPDQINTLDEHVELLRNKGFKSFNRSMLLRHIFKDISQHIQKHPLRRSTTDPINRRLNIYLEPGTKKILEQMIDHYEINHTIESFFLNNYNSPRIDQLAKKISQPEILPVNLSKSTTLKLNKFVAELDTNKSALLRDCIDLFITQKNNK